MSKHYSLHRNSSTTVDKSINICHKILGNGRIFVTYQGSNAEVQGVVYELVLKTNADGTEKLIRKKFRTTRGYVAKAGDASFTAIGETNGKQYRVVGRLKYLTKVDVNNKQNKVESISDSDHLNAYLTELKEIAAQRQAGFDPHVRMSFIVIHLKESRAGLYRKMGSTFPKPVKRGKSSFWPMSQIEAYKLGISEK